MLGTRGLAGTANYFTEMCSGSEAGSYLRLIDFVHHSTLGLVVKRKVGTDPRVVLLAEGNDPLRV